MKPATYLPPVCTLAVMTAILFVQHRSEQRVADQVASLRSALKEKQPGGSNGTGNTSSSPSREHTHLDPQLNWKSMAARGTSLIVGQNSADYYKVQRVLLDLPIDELLKAIDDIRSLDIPDPQKDDYLATIVEVLAARDPLAVLKKFEQSDLGKPCAVSEILRGALEKLGLTDPAAAAAWLDGVIAAGRLQSQAAAGTPPAIYFEGALLRSLITSDPALATDRLEKMTGRQRIEIFEGPALGAFPATADKTIAALLRRFVSEEQFPFALNNTIAMMAPAGPERMISFIEASGANPKQISRLAGDVLNSAAMGKSPETTAKRLKEALAWAGKYDPDNANTLAGEALARTISFRDFSTTSDLALQLAREGGGDALLGPFLAGSAGGPQTAAQALPLVENIQDPALREKLRTLLTYRQ